MAWPGGAFGQNFVRVILGNLTGPNAADNPAYVTPVSGGGAQATVTADQGAAGVDPWLVEVAVALPAGSAVIGEVGIDQTTPGTTNAVVPRAVAGTPTAYRSAVVAADVIAVPGTVTCTLVAGTNITAGTYTIFAVAGNVYGRTTAKQGDATVVAGGADGCPRAAFAAVTGATFFDLYCSTDGAASKFVGRVTEAQRAAGCAITAVNVVGAGGIPGAVDIHVAGTGLAVNGGQVAQNTAYYAENGAIAAIDPAGAENLDVNVAFSRTGDIVAGSLVLLPFYAGASSRWYAGDPVPVSFGGVANAYESTYQTLRLPVRGRQVKVLVGSLAGTGASVDMETVAV